MSNQQDRLNNMQTYLLLDIVKNYKQYGYSVEIQENAMSVLEKRGIEKESLILSGNFGNYYYEEAIRHYRKYNINVAMILISYVLYVFVIYLESSLFIILFLLVYIFFGFTLVNKKNITHIIKDDWLDYSVVILIIFNAALRFFDIPIFSSLLYFISYLIEKKQIKKRINMIR